MKPNALLAIVIATIAAVSLSLVGCGGPPNYAEALQTFTAEREQLEYIERQQDGAKADFDDFKARMERLRANASALGAKDLVAEIDAEIVKQTVTTDEILAGLYEAFDRQVKRVETAKADLDAAEKRRK